MLEKLKAKIDSVKQSSVNFMEKPYLLAPEDVAQERMRICKECPEYHKTEFCRSCGCYLPWKTKLAATSCPLKKWHKIEVDLAK